ncbi:Histone H1.1 [Cryptotermes secundus]|uniref:Histone H1.1 n=1 Tax=Cryptotermes secundus TaxID=105785 RepID=A0A2J7QR06_9NEOP|nr:histone H1-III [Cryptotermes secundus]XP_023726966.1 histone H1-III [Cryptotermes secundus]PNE09478.1 Histone H1.1 [Cryptotermes secundus]PNF30997.1 Histone H1.1 [Cryptotermes secundus]
MADSAESAPAAANPSQATPKKAKASVKKPRTKPVHPPTSEMVGNAIRSLKERGGSSLQAIKKYIAANYKVDSEKLSPFIKKYLKTAVASGELVQTKGKGASGSFRLAAAKPERSAVTDAPARGSNRSAGPKEKKKSVKSKQKAPKKASVKKVPEKKKASPAKGKKLPSKAKKVAKVPTKKPKAPRPRTAAKSKAPKKSSPKKK